MLFLVPIDLNKNELRNALVHVLAADPGSPTEGQVYYNSTSKVFKWYTGAAWRVLGTLDQISAPVASVSLNSQKITNLLDPTAAQDAATKAYVDSIAQGIAWKAPVRAATTVAGTLASSFEDGDVVDGVTLVTGDRVLIKDQAAPATNGIYVVAASGAPTRALDANSGLELLNAATLVEEGTTNADTLWVSTANAPITVGATSLPFVRIGGATALTAGDGVDITGTVISVEADPAGGLVVGTAGIAIDPPIPISLGGTNATSATTARASLGAVGKYAVDVGNAVDLDFDVVHNLGTTDVLVQVYTNPTDILVYADVSVVDANTVNVAFALAPATNDLRVVVVG